MKTQCLDVTADAMKIQVSTLRNRISRHANGKDPRGKVPPYIRTSGRTTVIPRDEFNAWMTSQIRGGDSTVEVDQKSRPGRPTKAEQIARRELDRS